MSRVPGASPGPGPPADPLWGHERHEEDGAVLFARYAYPPNALGYCGPADPASLLGAAAGPDAPGAVAELRARASGFEGAWPYLQLIAGCNGIPDPLDRRVVQAYWVGNDLLAHVPPSTLLASLDERFAPRLGRRFAALAGPLGYGCVAQHSFHVFAVYPWLGLLRAGMEGAPLTVLDRCRIRWGQVQSVRGDVVTVRGDTLGFDGHRLTFVGGQLETARLGVDGVGLAGTVSPGDWVSLHWDWVCERLAPSSLQALRACTSRNLAAVNASPVPGPAHAVGA